MKTQTALPIAMCFAIVLSACASSEPNYPVRRDDRDGGQKPRSSGPITALSSAGLLIASFNRNDDYSIDQTEFAQGRDTAFKIADGDGNDSLNLFELEHWRVNALGSADAAPGIMFFDADFNNIVTHQEFDVGLSNIYQNADKDGDGIIRFSELIRIVARQQRGGGETRTRQEGGGRGKGGGGRPPRG